MKLTDSIINKIKPTDKPQKLSDGGGLYLAIQPNGSMLWRFKYRRMGKEKLLSLGKYPAISIKEARKGHEAAKIILDKGLDPSKDKQEQAKKARAEAENTFRKICDEFIEIQRIDKAPRTIEQIIDLSNHLCRTLGNKPITEIEPQDIFAIATKLDKKGNNETARRVIGFASRVFKYAIRTGKCKLDAAYGLKQGLSKRNVKHMAALTNYQEIGALMRAISEYQGNALTKYAMMFLAEVYVRVGELRYAEWSEFDFEENVWKIPATKMKMRNDHAVPLSNFAIWILEQVKSLGLNSKYVFPSIRSGSRPMSENTINAALRGMGYTKDEMTGHGFRAIASTLLNESGKWSRDAIERSLAHGEKNAVRAAYHRSSYWEERVEMAKWYSNYLYTIAFGKWEGKFRESTKWIESNVVTW